MSRNIDRRTFLERTVALGSISITAAGLCVCALAGCVKKDRTPSIPLKWIEISDSELRVNIDRVPSLKRGGAAKIVHDRLSEPIIIVRPAETRFLALSGNCTHRGRPLEFESEANELRCINFGHSTFALDGSPKKGPAKRALKVYKTLYLNGYLEIFL
jgi:Rieske Fe-S protein